jgi:hypothetical protein
LLAIAWIKESREVGWEFGITRFGSSNNPIVGVQEIIGLKEDSVQGDGTDRQAPKTR